MIQWKILYRFGFLSLASSLRVSDASKMTRAFRSTMRPHARLHDDMIGLLHDGLSALLGFDFLISVRRAG